MSSSSQHSKPDCVILGAGILGLSIAQELLDHGYTPTIIARDLPSDLDSGAFSSPWAGASIVPVGTSPEALRREARTFERLAELAKHRNDIRETQYAYGWETEGKYTTWEGFKDIVRDLRFVSPETVPLLPKAKVALTFTSYTINTPAYYLSLRDDLVRRGVVIHRARVSALDEAYSLVGDIDLVINCTGLGARTLIGVEDPLVHPVRGQTVLVRAPGFDTCVGWKEDVRPGETTYMIPRPNSGGHVIVGGCSLKDNWSTQPDPAMAERILQAAFKACPAIANGGKSWKDIEVLAHNVGLRPAREGGMRLELERRKIGQDKTGLVPRRGQAGEGRDVACIHAYGIGPAGYQSSLGIAEEVLDLVKQVLGERRERGTRKARL